MSFEDQKNTVQKISAFRLGIHSGKGGVGKTFVAANIAYSLAVAGFRVGILDADIDCPNIAKFLGVTGIAIKTDQKIFPVIHNQVKIISTALLNPRSEAPIIIRGPIKHNMLLSFLVSTDWRELDYLIIDLPPGTADVPLSAMQLSALDGLILVTIPTKESLLDTSRAANLAKKLDIRIIGLIENMSGEIFGSKAEKLAKQLNVPFFGSIPLSQEIVKINERCGLAFLELELLKPFASNLITKIRILSARTSTETKLTQTK